MVIFKTAHHANAMKTNLGHLRLIRLFIKKCQEPFSITRSYMTFDNGFFVVVIFQEEIIGRTEQKQCRRWWNIFSHCTPVL